MVKNFEDIFIRFCATRERDRQTDGHRMPAIAARMHSIASHGKNVTDFFLSHGLSSSKSHENSFITV